MRACAVGFFTLQSIPKGKPPHNLLPRLRSQLHFSTHAGHWPPTVRKSFPTTWLAPPAMFSLFRKSRSHLCSSHCGPADGNDVVVFPSRPWPSGPGSFLRFFKIRPKILAQDLGPPGLGPTHHNITHLSILCCSFHERALKPQLCSASTTYHARHTLSLSNPISNPAIVPLSSPGPPHGPGSGRLPFCLAK